MRRLARNISTLLAGACGVATAYELVLLAAAIGGRERPGPTGASGRALRLAVLIPAHDEERTLPRSLAALAASTYPADLFKVVVVADNCTDRTAEVAADHGATVWRRDDQLRRGKGYALAWGLDRIVNELPEADAVVLVDADCTVSENLLQAVAARVVAGERAVQADYVVGNPDASRASAARFAAFALVNTVRPLGRTRLGFSCGLLGTGMAFASALLRERPWRAASLVEDRDYHLDLVESGERVVFAPEASVRSDMPTSIASAREQRARWESGRLDLVRRRVGRMLLTASRRRDVVVAQAAFDELIPPRSVTVGAAAAVACAGPVLGAWTATRVAVAALAGQVVFVLGGLAAVGAPPAAYRALALAPGLVAAKAADLLRLAARRGPSEWRRTERARAPG